jgi:4-amino-4-deoxy-L-arabinose transferase-like glycosyltransferase
MVSGATGHQGTQIAAPRAHAVRVARYAPWLLALFFMLWALRGIEANNVVDTDAARHAMNGAFIWDMVRNGQVTHPIEYGRYYYGRLPALSLPYHPPVFPAAESLFFAVLGVSVFTARLTVAIATAIAILVFYRLVWETHGSHLLAAFSVATFCVWRYAQAVSGDVMLEFPALAFALGALYLIRNLNTGYSLYRGLAFALLAGAAVWTKQHTVFLGLVPFLVLVFGFRWRLLFGKTIWISSALFGVLVIALTLLTIPFKGTGVDQVAPAAEASEIFLHNLRFYAQSFRQTLGLIPTILFVCAVVSAWFIRSEEGSKKPALALYWAWACSAFLVLLLIGPYDHRYLFFVYPPLAVIGFTALFQWSSAVFSRQLAWCMPAAVAAYCLVTGLLTPPTFLRGPAQTAPLVVTGKPRRILYCGSLDGNFAFAVRALDPQLHTVVVAGDKLDPSDLSPAGFEAFARRYGISAIVLERSARPQACDSLEASPTPSMVLRHRVPLSSSNPRWQGHLSVYSFLHPSGTPEDTLKFPVPKIGREVTVKLSEKSPPSR